MAEEPVYTLTKKPDTIANQKSHSLKSMTKANSGRYSKLIVRLAHLIGGVTALGAAIGSGSGVGLIRFMEMQTQSLFYQLRGPQTPPKEIVILAIDDRSISVPEQFYTQEPQKYPYLEPLKAYPYKRAAYAKVIEKLATAGARHIALDVVFDLPSSYGKEDDRQLYSALQKYGNKVTLAAVYENSETHQGYFWQLIGPLELFRDSLASVGSANFPQEIDGKVHKLADEFPKLLAKNTDFQPTVKMPSFDRAILTAANIDYPQPLGDGIYFYGGADTFEQIPFWHVLDPENWNTYLQQGKVFKNKIVLVGATAKLSQDYHRVPATNSWLYPEEMSGVEIHANAIATLMQGLSVAQAIKSPVLNGLFVLVLVGGWTIIVTRSKRGVTRFLLSNGGAIAWFSISYVSFVYSQLIFPTATPVLALSTIGLSYLVTDFAREKLRKRYFINVLAKHPDNRIVKEIISQQDDLLDLLKARSLEVSGKILDGRYKIVKVLGSGGFSETYVAQDTRLPGNPLCVVKQLQPANRKSQQLQIARRLFDSEAQTLQKLGTHKQIPQLLAYFEEEEEFYLVQEYIVGSALSQELPSGKRVPEPAVINMLQDLLQILVFVHQNHAIHRDIKPSNIIRRHSDNKLVLIDFGAVKEVSTQPDSSQTAFTIGIGTKGYAPPEQCMGRPQYNSDIYAVGMIGIRALTGIRPHEIPRDDFGEVKWTDRAIVSHRFAQILNQMVKDDSQQRYQSASAVIQALDQLQTEIQFPKNNLENTLLDDSDLPTKPWTQDTDNPDSSYSTSISPPNK